MERRCKVCGRILRVTQGNIGPVCGKTCKISYRKRKKAYLNNLKKYDIFKGENISESRQDAEAELYITE